jgi:hypothetical protein
VTQVEEHLPSKHEALNSNTSAAPQKMNILFVLMKMKEKQNKHLAILFGASHHLILYNAQWVFLTGPHPL